GGMSIASIVALVLLWDDPGSTSFVLTAIGLGVVIVGILVVSNVWKTPHYKVILAWDPEALPADWEAGRQRYFTINWIQFATTWAAFALFLVALGARWQVHCSVGAPEVVARSISLVGPTNLCLGRSDCPCLIRGWWNDEQSAAGGHPAGPGRGNQSGHLPAPTEHPDRGTADRARSGPDRQRGRHGIQPHGLRA